jgi:Spy/CpxP family protein refolding chaperone
MQFHTYKFLLQSGPRRRSTSHITEKEMIVKRSYKAAAGIAIALSLGLAAAAFAQPGPAAEDRAPQAQDDGQHGMMGHGGMAGAMMHGGMSGAGAGVHQSLITPEEHTAFQEKMRNAKTPEERQKLAQEMHEEMQKRAKEKGLTMPQHGGPLQMQ